MTCDICDYSTDGITSLTRHKKIHYTPQKPFDCTKCGKELRIFVLLIYINIIRPPVKTKCQRFNALFDENDNIHQDIKRFSFEPCGQIFRKKCTLSFHIEIKHPDPIMPVPEWSCEICKEPYPHSRALKGHIKWFHKTKQKKTFFIPCEMMYKTKNTLGRHTNSEESLKVKTKHEWKI